MAKARRERCPYCGFLDTIKWGKQCGHQRYKCKNCGSLFTPRRKDVSHNNRFIWFRWWVVGKQTIEQISELSGYSIRQLKTWFYEYLDEAPTWKIKRRESVNLLIDGTWFPNKVCLIVYRANNIKATMFYRLTDAEKEDEIIRDLKALQRMKVRIDSVTSDGGTDIAKAVKYACPNAIRQRCLAHIERECLLWITQHPKSAAGIELRRLVCQISHIKTHNDELYWKRCLNDWYDEYAEFLKEKTISPLTGQKSYTHDYIRKAYFHIWHALPDMFQFIDHPDIPKTTNGLESFFGHIKDYLGVHRGLSLEHHKNFVKWYLYFNSEKAKKKR